MNNVYFLGMCIAMVVFLIIGYFVSLKVKSAEDFYVAGRNAPVLLIAGSMIASYTSTGMFMGDAAQSYDGAFSPIIIFAGMQSAGYIIGAIFFGRYLRRSNNYTIPEFFGKRFCSRKLRVLAAVTAIITMTVYLLSVIQGIGSLMTVVTGANYNVCITLVLIVFTIISVTSGSRGVLITDTLMAALFTVAMVSSMLFIANNADGWFNAIATLTKEQVDLLSWTGSAGTATSPGPLGYSTKIDNVLWGLIYGVVWMSVCSVGPWQSSRYLMAKNEHVVIRSSYIAALGVFLMEFLTCMSGVFVNVSNPDIVPSSQALIWAAMNLMPKALGVLLLTGVLSAGISSATTFLSLIGSSVANDLLAPDNKNSVNISRIAMAATSLIVLIVAIQNSPAIFWIMLCGCSIVASSWMPVALTCMFWKRLTKTGAFCGMLVGFISFFGLRLYTAINGITLPVYLDPSLIGMLCNVIAMVIGTYLTKVTPEEDAQRIALFEVPKEEQNSVEIVKTLKYAKMSLLIGVAISACLLVFWAIPYRMSL